MRLKRSFIILFFLCILCSLFSFVRVYGVDLWIKNNDAEHFYNSISSNTASNTTIQTIGEKLSEYHLNNFRKLAENGYGGVDLPSIKFEYILSPNDGGSNITESITTNYLDIDVDSLFNYSKENHKLIQVTITIEIVSGEENSTTTRYVLKCYPNFSSAKTIITKLSDYAYNGIIGGSIECGYNVGVPYSLVQRPLTDLMELRGAGYEFKSLSSISYSFGYFYHPFLGNLYLNQEPYLPKSDEEWLKLLKDKKSEFIQNSTLNINEKFIHFANNLSPDNVNVEGCKITEAKIENAITRYAKVSGTKDPKNVLSYNVPMAVPYIFSVGSNGTGKLAINNLRQIDNYIYCLYNDCIYDSEMNRVASMVGEVKVPRDKIYLYCQLKGEEGEEIEDSNGNKTKKVVTKTSGVALISVFYECVADYREEHDSIDEYMKNLYLTGRQLTFDNGYSDSLNIWSKNANLLYANSAGGKIGYIPANVMFPTDIDYQTADIFLQAINPDVARKEPKLVEQLRHVLEYPKGKDFFENLWNSDNHGEIPTSNKAVKMYIDFGEIVNQSEVDEAGNITPAASKYVFYCVRNNAYVGDAELIDWLKTDEAKALTYVNADKLRNLIEGNFFGSLTHLTYGDWQKMQGIKEKLANDKDMWLIRVMNVVSLVFGTFLIIFAILFMMAYWIDIFNTFTGVSILHFISMGNLYPITDDITEDYLKNSMPNTKFVNFKQVLIIACIMIAAGILFLNTFYIIDFLVKTFNYILYLFGGMKK